MLCVARRATPHLHVHALPSPSSRREEGEGEKEDTIVPIQKVTEELLKDIDEWPWAPAEDEHDALFWDLGCLLEQFWAIREGLAEKPREG